MYSTDDSSQAHLACRITATLDKRLTDGLQGRYKGPGLQRLDYSPLIA